MFRPHVGTPLPMFVYVHLRGSKCVDRRRQGVTVIGTAVPTFVYIRLHHVDILRLSLSMAVDTPCSPKLQIDLYFGLKFRKSSHQPLGTQLLLGTRQTLAMTPNLIYHIGLHPAMVGLHWSTAVDQRRQTQTHVDTRTPTVSTCCRHTY